MGRLSSLVFPPSLVTEADDATVMQLLGCHGGAMSGENGSRFLSFTL